MDILSLLAPVILVQSITISTRNSKILTRNWRDFLMLIVDFRQCLRYDDILDSLLSIFWPIRSQFREKIWSCWTSRLMNLNRKNIIHMAVTKITWRDEEEDKSWEDMTVFFRKYVTNEYFPNLLETTLCHQIFVFWIRDLKFWLLTYFFILLSCAKFQQDWTTLILDIL